MCVCSTEGWVSHILSHPHDLHMLSLSPKVPDSSIPLAKLLSLLTDSSQSVCEVRKQLVLEFDRQAKDSVEESRHVEGVFLDGEVV